MGILSEDESSGLKQFFIYSLRKEIKKKTISSCGGMGVYVYNRN